MGIFSRFIDKVTDFLFNPTTVKQELNEIGEILLGGKPKPSDLQQKLDSWINKIQPDLIARYGDEDEIPGLVLHNFMTKLKMNSRVSTGLLRKYLQDQLYQINQAKSYPFFNIEGPTVAQRDQAMGKSYNRKNPDFIYGILYISATNFRTWSKSRMTTDDIEESTLTEKQRNFLTYF